MQKQTLFWQAMVLGAAAAGGLYTIVFFQREVIAPLVVVLSMVASLEFAHQGAMLWNPLVGDSWAGANSWKALRRYTSCAAFLALMTCAMHRASAFA